jgi:hypothetical protein
LQKPKQKGMQNGSPAEVCIQCCITLRSRTSRTGFRSYAIGLKNSRRKNEAFPTAFRACSLAARRTALSPLAQSLVSSATVAAACPMPRACVNCLMPNSIFRCPKTGLNVPRPFVPDSDANPNFYEHVPCPACGQSHLMHKSTGKLIGEPREE